MGTGELAVTLALVEHLCAAMSTPTAHRMTRVLKSVAGDVTRLEAQQHQHEPARTGTNDRDDLVWTQQGLMEVQRNQQQRIVHWRETLDRLYTDGVRVAVAGSSSYPTNLGLVPNGPPVLFVRGTLTPEDDRAIAVVGTRTASVEGKAKASTITRRLSLNNVTVVSGLAEGIDTAAHRAALDSGGRTIAVFGTGIDRVFPHTNRSLAAAVAANGACVSQWWPQQPGARWSFPLRNIVTSGLSLGTVVVEAGATSGARIQAMEARRHGRRLFLLDHLVTSQTWARELVGQSGVHVVRNVEQIMELVREDLDSDSFSLT